jgi:tRNA threonylcarbamoyladenosine biosynthesis protein TsaE
MKYTSRSLEETKGLARIFLDSIEFSPKHATVVALSGDLGSGKTAFVQAIGEIIGIEENLHSPTFVIEKIYPIFWKATRPEGLNGGVFKNLIHVDAYRLEQEAEILHLGWEKIIREPENLIFIEWPENVSGVIPENALKISLGFIDETTRDINIHG